MWYKLVHIILLTLLLAHCRSRERERERETVMQNELLEAIP